MNLYEYNMDLAINKFYIRSPLGCPVAISNNEWVYINDGSTVLHNVLNHDGWYLCNENGERVPIELLCEPKRTGATGWYLGTQRNSSRYLRKDLTVKMGTGYTARKVNKYTGLWDTELEAREAMNQYYQQFVDSEPVDAEQNIQAISVGTEPAYPLWRKAKATGLVLEFSEMKKATILAVGTSKWDKNLIGTVKEHWVPHNDLDHFNAISQEQAFIYMDLEEPERDTKEYFDYWTKIAKTKDVYVHVMYRYDKNPSVMGGFIGVNTLNWGSEPGCTRDKICSFESTLSEENLKWLKSAWDEPIKHTIQEEFRVFEEEFVQTKAEPLRCTKEYFEYWYQRSKKEKIYVYIVYEGSIEPTKAGPFNTIDALAFGMINGDLRYRDKLCSTESSLSTEDKNWLMNCFGQDEEACDNVDFEKLLDETFPEDETLPPGTYKMKHGDLHIGMDTGNESDKMVTLNPHQIKAMNDWKTPELLKAMSNGVCYKDKQTKLKGIKTMSKKNQIINAVQVLSEALCAEGQPEVEKTDLEAKLPFIVRVYSQDGEYQHTFQVESAKKAKKYLQLPENLGKTITISEEIKCFTTAIPLTEVN